VSRLPAHLSYATLGALLLSMNRGAQAQSIDAHAGRFFAAEDWITYRVGLTHPLQGSLALQFHGDVLKAVGTNGGMAGVGTDITVFRSGGEGPYLVAGLSGGLGSESTNELSNGWGSWSAGAGYDVFPLTFLSVGIEARWRGLSLVGRSGPELNLGLQIHPGGGSAPARTRPTSRVAAPPVVTTGLAPAENPRSLADSIVATAMAAMGRPYQYGGTGAGGGGFDCSGLIQFAYKQHGIDLPRRSVEQAKEGKKVGRKLDRLQAADLLTFSNRAGSVTHVGLYIGEGRFIHSATRGVQVSVLSADDPYGRWWYQRWVGVRRIIR
jgi:cell wall-associated NlpC family hydrolase